MHARRFHAPVFVEYGEQPLLLDLLVQRSVGHVPRQGRASRGDRRSGGPCRRRRAVAGANGSASVRTLPRRVAIAALAFPRLQWLATQVSLGSRKDRLLTSYDSEHTTPHHTTPHISKYPNEGSSEVKEHET